MSTSKPKSPPPPALPPTRAQARQTLIAGSRARGPAALVATTPAGLATPASTGKRSLIGGA